MACASSSSSYLEQFRCAVAKSPAAEIKSVLQRFLLLASQAETEVIGVDLDSEVAAKIVCARLQRECIPATIAELNSLRVEVDLSSFLDKSNEDLEIPVESSSSEENKNSSDEIPVHSRTIILEFPSPFKSSISTNQMDEVRASLIRRGFKVELHTREGEIGFSLRFELPSFVPCAETVTLAHARIDDAGIIFSPDRFMTFVAMDALRRDFHQANFGFTLGNHLLITEVVKVFFPVKWIKPGERGMAEVFALCFQESSSESKASSENPEDELPVYLRKIILEFPSDGESKITSDQVDQLRALLSRSGFKPELLHSDHDSKFALKFELPSFAPCTGMIAFGSPRITDLGIEFIRVRPRNSFLIEAVRRDFVHDGIEFKHEPTDFDETMQTILFPIAWIHPSASITSESQSASQETKEDLTYASDEFWSQPRSCYMPMRHFILKASDEMDSSSLKEAWAKIGKRMGMARIRSKLMLEGKVMLFEISSLFHQPAPVIFQQNPSSSHGLSFSVKFTELLEGHETKADLDGLSFKIFCIYRREWMALNLSFQD